MACPLVHPLLWTWLCPTTLCVFFTITSFNQWKAPARTVRKRYLISEVAANFIQILWSTPAEILPAPCYFIVDSFNHKIKSMLDSVVPLLIKIINTRPTPMWRNTETKKLKRNSLRGPVLRGDVEKQG